MAYAAWSVTFGEQPTATKWNILGTNDASFNDGTGIAAAAIVSSHLDANLAGGWIAAGETWTYASADDPTFTFTISGDKTAKYSVGMKIKLTQTTPKYFIITAVSYSAPNTTVTVYGGTDYDLANAAITSPFYSMARAPQGFPMDPAKWTVEALYTGSGSQAASTGTWYNIGGFSIAVPIGAWDPYFYGHLLANNSGANAAVIYSTLSNANNTELSATNTVSSEAGLITYTAASFSKRCPILNLAAKATYYLNHKVVFGAGTETLYLRGSYSTAVIRMVCAYL